ncbi:tellurite resistance TerB family protein [Tranquillimonas alkanivorans]|uniref:Uncharacterized membrane protein YebE, DUF533 family n=1 Tax=Tranquillimonas alkanivorans TaxID=441119 RepID=A0A1I5RYB2_9RHOB|nr:DUF533 domain-containing protein [Tranquillimonas alkanivorans]SFP63518.1 Uncharacterized membrane protein YebE, DUF533 family [Tranquillimonas alkanivorans]
MSLKRVLGVMLASRMAGRGRRRGGLGTAAMLGGLGHRRRGLGGKLGIAALGYMAYRAYQDQQAKGGTGKTGSASGGIGGMIKDVADKLTGGGTAQGAEPAASDVQEQERAAESFSDDTALLLIRAMITAAYSDGALSNAERERIPGEIEQADADAEDRRVMEREIANPRPLDELLAQVNDEETAQEFYLASRAALDGETAHDREYLAALRRRLNLSEEDAAEAEELAS